MPDLKLELKEFIIATLSLEEVTPEEIDDTAPLFSPASGAASLDLDSIDALELAVALERRYGVSIPDETVAKRAFASVEALAAFVAQARSASSSSP